MPLEPLWRTVLQEAASERLAVPNREQWSWLLQEDTTNSVQERLLEAGQYNLSAVSPKQRCSSGAWIKKAADELTASWQQQQKPLHGRGASLQDPAAVQHPAYAAQRLFSIYVHHKPDFRGYGSDSIFHGREIVPRSNAPRFSHALGRLTLYLLEAALTDSAVHNARFVTVSESCVPIYNGGVLYLQLMHSARSRVELRRSGGLTELLMNISNLRVSPWMFTEQVRGSTLQKARQWVALTRADAFAATYDKVVEPWFALFAGRSPRCEARPEQTALKSAVAAYSLQDVRAWLRKADRWGLVADMQAKGQLPLPFTSNGVLWGMGAELRRQYVAARKQPVPTVSQLTPKNCTDAQTAALQAYRPWVRKRLRMPEPEQAVGVRPRRQLRADAPPTAGLSLHTHRVRVSAAQRSVGAHQSASTVLAAARTLQRLREPSSSGAYGPAVRGPWRSAGVLATEQQQQEERAGQAKFNASSKAARWSRRRAKTAKAFQTSANASSTTPTLQSHRQHRAPPRRRAAVHPSAGKRWTPARQALFHSFLGPPRTSIVSDAFLVHTILNKYGINGDDEITMGAVTHSDWARMHGGGHPGDYGKARLQRSPRLTLERVRVDPSVTTDGADCLAAVQQSYASAHLVLAGAAPAPWLRSSLSTDAAPLARIVGMGVRGFVPLPDKCVLLARKFGANTASVERFWLGCEHVGLRRDCLRKAAQAAGHTEVATTLMGSVWVPTQERAQELGRRIHTTATTAPTALLLPVLGTMALLLLLVFAVLGRTVKHCLQCDWRRK